jgi:RND family efflux transporter MFP subunit
MKTSHKIALAGVIAVAVAAGYALSHRKGATPVSTSKTASLSVTLTTPQHVNWPLALPAQGAVAAWQESIVSTEIGGLRIAQVSADVGSAVKRGQELATLSQDSVTAALHQQEASVAQTRAILSQAKADADRARSVASSGALSEQKVQEYLIAEETAQANLAAAQAALESARINLARTHILAPDDGIISSRTAAVGTVVAAGTEMFRLVRQGRIEWRAEVAAPQLGGVRAGQKAILDLPQGGMVEGRVRMVAPTLSSDTRTALVYVDLPHGSAAKPGMYAQGRIELGMQAALTVPQSSVVLRDGLSYVFEVGPEHHALQRQVKTGRMRDEGIEILSGLAPDAKIVLTGGAFLNHGDPVSVVE